MGLFWPLAGPIGMMMATVCVGAAAHAEDVVAYRMDVLGEVPVLVPKVVTLRASGSLVERARGLFVKLRKVKPQSYGQATLDLSGERGKELEHSRMATLLLDGDRPRARGEVIAEVVHSFAGLGITAVRVVEGKSSQTLTRADIDTSAFVLALPFWMGLPPAPLQGALVRMPGGELVSTEALEEKLKRGDSSLVQAVEVILGEKRLRPALRAARAMGSVPPDVAKPRLMGLLKHENARMRAAAVDGLAAHKSGDVTRALAGVLSDDREEEVKVAAARALVESGDRGAAQQGIEFLLKSGDADRKVAILSKVKGSALEGLAEALLPLLADSQAKVRAAALGALAGQRDEKILAAFAERLDKDTDESVRDAAARALLASGAQRFVARGLAFELRSADEQRAISAAQQLGGMGADGREPLEAQLPSGPKPVRTAIARALERIGDAKSLVVLAPAAEKGLRAARKAASTLLANLEPAALAKLIKESDGYVRLLAARSVREGSDAGLQEALATSTRDKDKDVRAAIARAIGRQGGGGAQGALTTLLEDEADNVRRSAADALGDLRDPVARPALMKLMKYGTVSVRRAVYRSLSRLKPPLPRETVPLFIEALYDEDAVVRERVLDTLATVDKRDPRVGPVVRLQLKDQVSHVRAAAVRALGTLGQPAHMSAVEDALTDEAADVRLAAVVALESIGGDKAAAALEKHAASEKDKKIADRAREAIARAKAKQDG